MTKMRMMIGMTHRSVSESIFSGLGYRYRSKKVRVWKKLLSITVRLLGTACGTTPLERIASSDLAMASGAVSFLLKINQMFEPTMF